jgi:hypothetical protein
MEISNFWPPSLQSFQARKVKNQWFLAPSIDENAIFLPHFSLDKNNLLSHFVAKTFLFLAI